MDCLFTYVQARELNTIIKQPSPTHRDYLMLSLPLIVSTITTPLLGLVDTAVVGHLFDPAYLGGTAIGTLIFNTMYWLFGFLRVSTSGFAAQARGKDDLRAGADDLLRPLAIALVIGLCFIVLQVPIFKGALWLMRPDANVAHWAGVYFHIRIWGAPITLLNYVLIGWLMGMSHIRQTLIVQISMNVLNMALAIWFAQGLHFGVTGVAAATLFAEGIALIAGLWFVWRSPYMQLALVRWKGLFAWSSLLPMFRANGDLLVRTICLLAMFNIFTAQSTAFGPELLAANSILIQLHYMMAYFFDGFANASSIYAGRAKGAGDSGLLRRSLQLTRTWTLLTALLLTLIYGVGRELLVRLFSDNEAVISLALAYNGWLLLFPICAGFGLVFYGIFTGMTLTAPVRNSMLLALLLYVLACWILVPLYGNHGLWISFLLFAVGRSVFLVMYVPGLEKRLIGQISERAESTS
ncbi:MATE family multidrug resistance protein [Paenibacillus hunanensis]|uniref:MATE family multidrug resistance protein n=2 Tax=Paenibacillus hunanensis TaxID=539262 RepID=A0ABU1J3S1_9BACL|nr:MATE family multidrug resistance protein [Paenibacillus hunanensis]